MKFLVEWLGTRGPNNAPELAATAARISIVIANQTVTEFREAQENTVRPSIVMPAYVLAEGFVQRWWTLMGGRGCTVRLRTFRQGFAVPDISIHPDSTEVEVVARPFAYDNPPVSFLNSARELVARSDFDCELRAFIENVVSHLAKLELDNSELAQYWRAIQTSDQNVSERDFCLAAGALGCDPYAISEQDAALLEQASTIFSDEPLREFLSAIGASRVDEAVTWIRQEDIRLGVHAALPKLDDIGGRVEEVELLKKQRRGISDTTLQRRRARLSITQRQIDLNSVDALAKAFGGADFGVSRRSVQGLRAVIEHEAHSTRIIVGGERPEQSKLFTLARAVGDSIVFGEDRRTAITDNETRRQAIGRAFAAELLAPAELVSERLKEGWTLGDIAIERGVGEQVIKHQIENLPAG